MSNVDYTLHTITEKVGNLHKNLTGRFYGLLLQNLSLKSSADLGSIYICDIY